MKKMKKQKGITIIALVVTIILMLILASVTINVVIDGGLFGYAKNAKDNTEIASEKETVQKATIIAKSTSKTGRITVDEMQKAINKVASEENITVMDNGATKVVKFEKSNRYYEIDSKGNVEGPKEFTKDENAGDITKGGEYDGSEDEPFKITCIEDLVAFSIMTNGGNTQLSLANNNFNGKYVELTRTIDFKSIFSYNDYTTTKYGDLNTDGKVEDLRTELTKTEEGCIGFTPIKNFSGTFDGKENMIENIYMNRESNGRAGLFALSNNSTNVIIMNLSLGGTIISSNTQGYAGGFCTCYNNTVLEIENCKNYANVTAKNFAGGIISSMPQNCTITNCTNYGTITKTAQGYSYSGVGGIAGSGDNIENCTNEGDIICTYTVNEENSPNGGIVGYGGSNIKNCINRGKACGGMVGVIPGTATITNCINEGTCLGGILYNGKGTPITITNCINKGKCSGGIVYKDSLGGVMNILNCYNIGECDNGIITNAVGSTSGDRTLNVKNCYNLGETTSSGIVGTTGRRGTNTTLNLNVENCYNAGQTDNAIFKGKDGGAGTITITNTYYDQSKSTSAGAITEGITALNETDIKNNSTFISTLNNNIGENTGWKRWKIGENGWPTFE